jgi:hypothetical protein
LHFNKIPRWSRCAFQTENHSCVWLNVRKVEIQQYEFKKTSMTLWQSGARCNLDVKSKQFLPSTSPLRMA